jgi:repressor LexA
MPELAIEDIEGYVTLDSSFFKCRGAYLLRAVGESMIEAGIENDDFLLIRPQSDAEAGDIVIAMIDDEATVKRFIKKDGQITLKPENPTMEPIEIDGTKKFEIVGKVVDVIKRLEG